MAFKCRATLCIIKQILTNFFCVSNVAIIKIVNGRDLRPFTCVTIEMQFLLTNCIVYSPSASESISFAFCFPNKVNNLQ